MDYDPIVLSATPTILPRNLELKGGLESHQRWDSVVFSGIPCGRKE